MKTQEWNNKDSKSATKEGWDLFFCSGSADGILQVQRIDELNILKDDVEAWEVVKHGNSPHHIKAKALLKECNKKEYNRVI